MTAVSDSGPLIHLSWIDQLEVLHHIVGEILIPSQVEEEVFRRRIHALGLDRLQAAVARGWIRMRPAQNTETIAALAQHLQRGEAEAIALLQEANATSFWSTTLEHAQ